MNAAKPRHAFTLVELLVVIAVIGIMMAMLMPAVQSIRESARRTNCLSNIRQVGLANQNYLSALQRYPSGWIERDPDCLDVAAQPCASYRYGWATILLPYIEGDNLFRSYDLQFGFWDDPTTTGVEEDSASVISIYTCPSDPVANLNPVVEGGDVHAKLNFMGSIGVDYMGDHFLNNATGGTGLFYMNSRVRPAEITDGSSHVIAFSERSGSNPDNGVYQNQGIRIGLIQDDPASAIQTETGPVAFPALELANQLAMGPFDPTLPGAAAASVNSEWFGINGSGGGPNVDRAYSYTVGFSSAHQSVTVTTFADGSTHLLNESINIGVFRQLLHKSDGGVVDASLFR